MTFEIFSPKWFYGYDAIFELVSVVAVILIAWLSYKAYRFTKNKNYKYLTFSFLLIGLSFIVKTITNLIIYFEPLKEKQVGFLIISYYNIQRLTMVHDIGYFFFRITVLLGFLIILLLALKIKDKKEISLLVFFIIISTMFSNSQYFIFHITCAFMLNIIFHYFFLNWRKKRTESSLTLALAFFMILLSQIVFIFVVFNKSIYVIGEIFQLFGYLVLLYTYLLVLRVHK